MIPIPETLDLSNLKEITGGDADLEKQLFSVFIECGEGSLAVLGQIAADGEQMDWKEHSHSIKGEAANLGANKLAMLCQQSQALYTGSAADKKAILEEIKKEWVVITTYLKQLL